MLLATNLPNIKPTDIFRGEARDVYVLENKLISVATDRINIFGHIFAEPIPHKGQVLTALTYYFANATNDIVPNWIESMPDPNVLIGKRCDRFEVNMIIRGAMVGHLWRIYEAGMRTICGVELPDGLKEYDLLSEPIITPTTKAQAGYEEDITAAEIIERGLMSEAEYERLSILARQLFIRGKQMARDKRMVLADTKYEFGRYEEEIYVIDEIHTPDSSRYFMAEPYERFLSDRNHMPPEHISKEYIRQWALGQNFSGLENQMVPVLTPEVSQKLSAIYVQAYEQLTGEAFDYPDPAEDMASRITKNIKIALAA